MVPRDFQGPQVAHLQRFRVTYSIDGGRGITCAR